MLLIIDSLSKPPVRTSHWPGNSQQRGGSSATGPGKPYHHKPYQPRSRARPPLSAGVRTADRPVIASGVAEVKSGVGQAEEKKDDEQLKLKLEYELEPKELKRKFQAKGLQM
jgi:hypothetical protein